MKLVCLISLFICRVESQAFLWTTVSACGFDQQQNETDAICYANTSQTDNDTMQLSVKCTTTTAKNIYRLVQIGAEPHRTLVPLGYPSEQPCMARTQAVALGEIVTDLCWIKLHVGGPLEIPKSGTQWRFTMDESSGSLLLGNAQMDGPMSDEGVYECHVKVKSGAEFVSRNFLQIQNCTDDTAEDNPCAFGKCNITQVNGTYLKILRCICIKQFTGPFCDQPIYIVSHELMFAWPILFYAVALGIGILVASRVKYLRRTGRLNWKRKEVKINKKK